MSGTNLKNSLASKAPSRIFPMQKGQEFHYLKHPTSFFGAVFPHYTQGGGGGYRRPFFFLCQCFMSSNTLGVRNSQNMHPFELSVAGHLFLEHPTPQAVPYILCWVTIPRVKSITKNSSLFNSGFMGAALILVVPVTWALQYT